MTSQIFIALAPLIFTVFAVAGVGDTYTRFTKTDLKPSGDKLSSKVMALLPSGISIVYFFVTWIVGLYPIAPAFPNWKGWVFMLIAGAFVGVANNFFYDKFLYKLFSKESTDKIADGIAEKVIDKVVEGDKK